MRLERRIGIWPYLQGAMVIVMSVAAALYAGYTRSHPNRLAVDSDLLVLPSIAVHLTMFVRHHPNTA